MRLTSLTSRFVSALALIVFCASSWATPQQLLSDFQTVRLNAAASLTNYYMYSGLDLDNRYKQRLLQNKDNFEQALSNAEKLAAANQLTDEVAEMQATWQKFSKLIDDNLTEIERQGFPNVRLVNEMASTSDALIEQATAARDLLYEKSGVTPNAVVQKTRTLALVMERITAQYAARGTSNLGQVFVGSSDQTLNDMAESFASTLQLLETETGNTAASEEILSSIHSKWRFMEQRIKNYNENAVVFLVVSYNDRIIEHLQELEALYL